MRFTRWGSRSVTPPEVHELLWPLEGLLGKWQGTGAGRYPIIDEFEFDEEIRFWHFGKPVLAYRSRSWCAGTKEALHDEMGFWRVQGDGSIEVVLAHSTGLAEVMHGEVDGDQVSLVSVEYSKTPTGTAVDQQERVISLRGDLLSYEMSMSFEGHPLQNHLRATLHRTERLARIAINHGAD